VLLLLLAAHALLPQPRPPEPAARTWGDDSAPLAWAPLGAEEPAPTPAPRPSGRVFFLVLSPESSGNRYLVQLLHAAGCAGAGGHVQPFDDVRRWGRAWPHHLELRGVNAPCAAAHRSVPHGGAWPNVSQLAADVRAAGWHAHVLTLVRADDAVIASQVAARHAPTRAAAQVRIAAARQHIAAALAARDAPSWDVVAYEQLARASYTEWLFAERIGRPLPTNAPAFRTH
jgi:hypothetical protein